MSSAATSALDVAAARASRPWSPALTADLRSDHAGETGAVYIYKGALAASGLRPLPADALTFVREHLGTEESHLELFEEMLDAEDHSRLLPLWKVCGFALGFVPTVLGPRALYATIEAVESFVEEHYDEQLEYMAAPSGATATAAAAGAGGTQAGFESLVAIVRSCREDEVHHKEDAARRFGASAERSLPVRAWAGIIGAGSRAAVAAARVV